MMNRKEDFKAELIEWKRREIPELVKRSVELPLKSSNIVSLCGCRMSGKTFLLFQTIKTLSLSRDDLIYINFESERLRNLDARDLQDFLIAVKEVFSPQDKIYLFLDEIQSVRDWDKWVRRIYDTGGYYIFITGSTSRLLPREIFSYKVKDRLQYPKKIYMVDTGLINELVSKFSENYGRFMENVVAIELKRREQEI